MKFAIDIDDTIAATNLYWGQQISKLIPVPEDASLHELMTKYKYINKIPGWSNSFEFMELLSEKTMDQILLVKGAKEVILKYPYFAAYLSTPDGHPKYPTCGHLKIPHLNDSKM